MTHPVPVLVPKETGKMMSMKFLTAIGAITGLCLLAPAQSNPQAGQVRNEAPCVWLSSELVGMNVVSSEGEKLGKIEDIVVHPGGEVAYAVLSFGGWMGVGDKLFAMPWTVLRAVEPDTSKKDSHRSLVLPLAKDRLKSAPGFDKKSWPTMANADWAAEIDAYYAEDRPADAKRPVPAAARPSVITWKGSELKGFDVTTPAGDELGDVREIAVDTNGRVSYVVLSVGGFLGINDSLVAVPWEAMKSSLEGEQGDQKKLTLAATKDQLEQAPRFKEGKDHRSEMCDPEWIGEVYQHFSCRPYWTASSEVKGDLGEHDRSRSDTRSN